MGLLDLLSSQSRRFASLQAKVQRSRESGNTQQALADLLRAERGWSWNWTNGSPASHVADAERLRWVMREAASLKPAAAEKAGAVDAVLQNLLALMRDKSSFRFDGRMMKPESAKRWVRLQDEFEGARAGFRVALATEVTPAPPVG